MSILDRVKAKQAEITPKTPAGTQAGDANRDKAVAAILGGAESPAFETYMEQYLDPVDPADPNSGIIRTKQLLRLLGTDNKGDDPEMQRRRAYLVANAVCAQGTGDGLTNKVDTIDDGL